MRYSLFVYLQSSTIHRKRCIENDLLCVEWDIRIYLSTHVMHVMVYIIARRWSSLQVSLTRSSAVADRARCFVSLNISLTHSSLGHSKWHPWAVEQGVCKSLLVFHYVYVRISYHFWYIQHQIMAWPWNLGYGWFELIKNGIIRKLVYSFLFAFDSNDSSVSFYFLEKVRYWSKITMFSFDVPTQLNSTELNLTAWTTVDSVCRSWRHKQEAQLVLG